MRAPPPAGRKRGCFSGDTDESAAALIATCGTSGAHIRPPVSSPEPARFSETAAFIPVPKLVKPPIVSQPFDDKPLEQAVLPPPMPPVINLPKASDRAEKIDSKKAKPAQVSNANLPLPDLTQLKYYEGHEVDTAELGDKATLIEETLASFKVDALCARDQPGAGGHAIHPGARLGGQSPPHHRATERSGAGACRARVFASKRRCRGWRELGSRSRTHR